MVYNALMHIESLLIFCTKCWLIFHTKCRECSQSMATGEGRGGSKNISRPILMGGAIF